jgi:hypothetical protein
MRGLSSDFLALLGNGEKSQLTRAGTDSAAFADLGEAGRRLFLLQGPLVFLPKIFFFQAVVDEVPREEFVGGAFPQGEEVRVRRAFL